MSITKTEYAQKLKDPRWQKKRLKIFERDNFTCVRCGNTDKTLHVHHLAYSNGDPWEIHDIELQTLCETCHEYEHSEPGKEAMQREFDNLEGTLKRMGFGENDIYLLDWMFISLSRNQNIRNFEYRKQFFDSLRYMFERPDVAEWFINNAVQLETKESK